MRTGARRDDVLAMFLQIHISLILILLSKKQVVWLSFGMMVVIEVRLPFAREWLSCYVHVCG